jgi:hypothetical protein
MKPVEVIEALLDACRLATANQVKVIYGSDMQILSNLEAPEYLVVLPFNAKDSLLQVGVKQYDCLIACLKSIDQGEGSEKRMLNDAEALERLYDVRSWIEATDGLQLTVAPTYNTGYVVESLTYSGATMKFTVSSNYQVC